MTAYGSHRVTTESSTGSKVSNRVYVKFTIAVKSVDFDAGASELHLSGQIARENNFAKLGQHQTLHLKVSDELTLEKADAWDDISLEVLRELKDPKKRANKSTVVIAVIMQEGLANICAITEHRTVLKQRVSTPIPKKRQGGAAAHDEVRWCQRPLTASRPLLIEQRLGRFFDQILTALLKQISVESEQPILLASPGFTANAFLSHMQSDRSADRINMKEYQSRFLVAHSSSGHVHALYEVMKSPEIQNRLHMTKFVRETKLMDAFTDLLRKDEGWAWYGPGEVAKAVERGAVGKGGGRLLVSLSLFRAKDIDVRKRYVDLVDSVKDYGGEVTIFSDQTESGKRLEGLGGVATILTYPLQDLDQSDDEDGEIG